MSELSKLRYSFPKWNFHPQSEKAGGKVFHLFSTSAICVLLKCDDPKRLIFDSKMLFLFGKILMDEIMYYFGVTEI